MILRFLHFLGFAMWMGGGWATMALTLRSRKDTPATRAGLFRIMPAAFGVMAAGAVVTVASGLGLAVFLMSQGLSQRMGDPGVIIMQTSGLLAALLLLIVGWPTSRKLSALAATDPLPPQFESLRRRQAAVSSVAGILGLLALIGATLI
jgi:hypothetical protein